MWMAHNILFSKTMIQAVLWKKIKKNIIFSDVALWMMKFYTVKNIRCQNIYNLYHLFICFFTNHQLSLVKSN